MKALARRLARLEALAASVPSRCDTERAVTSRRMARELFDLLEAHYPPATWSEWPDRRDSVDKLAEAVLRIEAGQETDGDLHALAAIPAPMLRFYGTTPRQLFADVASLAGSETPVIFGDR